MIEFVLGLSFKINLFYFMCRSALPACMYMICVCSAHNGHKRTSNSLELELHMVLRRGMGAGN